MSNSSFFVIIVMVGECMKTKLIITVVIAIISFFPISIFFVSTLYDVPSYGGEMKCYQRNEYGKCIRSIPTNEERLKEEEETRKEIFYYELYKIFVLTLFVIFTILIVIYSKQYNRSVPILLIVTLFIIYFVLFFLDEFLDLADLGRFPILRWLLFFDDYFI